MNTASRLAKLEGTLSPKEATLAWLADAQRFPTLTAYVGWLVTQPPEAAPFWRVPEQAEQAVRASMRGQPRDVVAATAHQAVRDAVFLVELVIRLNVDAAELVRTETLRAAALAWVARATISEAEPVRAIVVRRGRSAGRVRRTPFAREVSGWCDTLDDLGAARRLLEQRHLNGQATLFPGAASAWRALIERATSLAELGQGPGRPRQGHRPSQVAHAGRLSVTVGSNAFAAAITRSVCGAALSLLGHRPRGHTLLDDASDVADDLGLVRKGT